MTNMWDPILETNTEYIRIVYRIRKVETTVQRAFHSYFLCKEGHIGHSLEYLLQNYIGLLQMNS